MAMEVTGKFAPFEIKLEDGQWVLNEKEEDKDKFKYIIYAGTTHEDKKEIYRLIYNSEFSSLPANSLKLKNQ